MKREKLATWLRKASKVAVALEHEVKNGAQDQERLTEALEELHKLLSELEAVAAKTEDRADELGNTRRQLTWERQRYSEFFNSAADGYIITDQWGNILDLNHAASVLLGVELRFLQGKPIRSFFHDTSQSELHSRLAALDKLGRIERWEAVLVTRHETEVDVLIEVRPGLFTADAGNIELRWCIRDISEQQRALREERDQLFRISFERADVGIGHTGPRGEWLRVNHRLCEIIGCSSDDLLGSKMGSSFHVDDIPHVREVLRQLLAGNVPAPFEARCMRRDESIVWVRVTASAVRTSAGNFMYNIIVIDDVTERRRIQQAEREQRIYAEALRDTALALTSAQDFPDVIDQIVLGLGRIVPYDAAGLILVEGENAYVARTHSHAASELQRRPPSILDARVRIEDVDFLREVHERRQPILRPEWSGQQALRAMDGAHEPGSFVAAPIIGHERIIGFLYLHSRTPAFFGEHHADLLRVFASQAAIAVQNTQMHQQAKALAVMQERSRLARELHDAVTQNLFMAHMISDVLATTWQDVPDNRHKQLRQLQTVTRAALSEMRTLLIELRPEHLASLDLGHQLRQLVEAFQVRKQVEVSLDIQGPEPTPPGVRVALYRIAQEAFNNIMKHAQATRVEVRMEGTPDSAHLSICDNGVGFNHDEISGAAGMGLQSMQERAAEIRAALQVESAPGSGTKVDVMWQSNGDEDESG